MKSSVEKGVASTPTTSTINASPESEYITPVLHNDTDEWKLKIRPVRPGTATSNLKREEERTVLTGMRFVDSEEIMKMMNTAYKEHSETSTSCSNPQMEAYRQKKWEVCWTYYLRCLSCTYCSKPFKLYKEINNQKPGPNQGAPNIALATALQDSPIGNSKTQEILARINCPPPSRTSINRTSNTVGEKTVNLNKQDMTDKLEMVKAVNRQEGRPENEINVTVDGRYNSQTIISKKKPGQNASQAFSLAIQTTTDMKYIVAAVWQNQLCWKGAWLRGQVFDVSCPGGHEDCTANHYRAAPLSEYNMGKDIGTQLALQNTLVKYTTTDGDGRSAAGIDDAMRALHPMWKVNRLADHVHLGQTQFRTAMRAVFSEGMFHGKTKGDNRELQKIFSKDVKCRTSMVMSKLMAKYEKNIDSICKDLPEVLEATLLCYSGD